MDGSRDGNTQDCFVSLDSTLLKGQARTDTSLSFLLQTPTFCMVQGRVAYPLMFAKTWDILCIILLDGNE